MRWVLAILPILLVACGRNAKGHEAPKLPPLALAPKLVVFKKLADAGPPPSAKRMAQLEDLMETAFSSDSSSRLAAKAQRSLLEAPDAFWILEQGLENDEARIRTIAAQQLGEHGTQASILPLLKRLKYEEEPGVIVWVAESLVRLGNHAGLATLISLMEKGDVPGRVAPLFRRTDGPQQAGLRAIEVLEFLGVETGERPSYGQLKSWLKDLLHKWRQTGIGEGGKFPKKPDALTTARIAQQLAQLQEFQLRPVDDARFILMQSGVLVLDLLKEAVQASEPYVRIHSLEIARDLGRPAQGLGPTILPLLADPLSRTYAAQALGGIGAKNALPRLLVMLENPEAELRAAAAEALGSLGCRDAIPPLRAVLANEKETMDVRVRAAFSLALFELERPALEFLKERKAKGDYHAPTIDELINRVEQQR